MLTVLILATFLQEPAAGLLEDPARVEQVANDLREHVRALAADRLEGRRAGTAAGDQAAYYLAGAMAAAGLEPAGEDGSWFQTFEVEMPLQPGPCSLVVTTQRGEELPFEGVGTLAYTASAAVRAELVRAGYGMVLESHDMNEYADAGVGGKVVLVRRYSEFGPDADPPFDDLGDLRTKIKNAASAGAVGVILGAHPDDLARGGAAEIPFDGARGTGRIPVVTVAPEDVVRLEQWLADGKVASVSIAASLVERRAKTLNVLGRLPGRSDEVVVVGGHYDHLGWGGQGSLAPGVEAVHNGADDNASGTAVILELAQLLAARPEPPPTDVLFVLWGAEEMGLLGSKHWVQNPTVPLDHVLCNLNLDMVGRLQGGSLTVGGSSSAAGFTPALDKLGPVQGADGAPALRFQVVAGELPGGGGSDHMSFHAAEIPALFFFSGLHSDYHKPSDDWQKLDYARMALLTGKLEELVLSMGAWPLDRATLAFVKPAAPPEEEMREVKGARAWFGSIPDYGAQPEGGGMQIAGTSPGGPAEKAGLQAGDVIKRVGEIQVVDIYDFMDALAEYRPGDKVQVVVLRQGEELELPVLLSSRGGNE